MPATRRSRTSSGPAPKGAQKTLSFNTSSKVTKPLPKEKSTHHKPSTPSTHEVPLELEPETGSVTSAKAVAQQAAIEISRIKKEKTPEEQKAERVTEAQIRRYWRDREAERRAPRVHQGGVSIEEKILRLFDMSSQFGPAIGMARMKRWVRANKLGLAPPIEVLAVLMREEERGNGAAERAYVDELMSSKFVVGDA